MASSNDLSDSPFFHRNYGGFTAQQKEFYEEVISPAAGVDILDPMGGQGYYLAELSRKKAFVRIGDINPAPLFLASLRDPEMIIHREALRDSAVAFLNKYFSKEDPRSDLMYTYEDEWMSPPIRRGIQHFASILNTKSFEKITENLAFWESDIFTKFIICLPVLAARDIITFHYSDNKTWLMPGGLIRETGIYCPLKRALEKWYAYADDIACQIQKSDGVLSWGSLKAIPMNVEKGRFGNSPRPTVIITSPPYANRMDYTRMWHPELSVISELFDIQVDFIKSNQVGSTTVRGKEFEKEDYCKLPKTIQNALEDIRKDSDSKASERYYFPFFYNYAVAIQKSLDNMAKILNDNGTIVIFFRDTVRKDILFPVNTLVRTVLEDNHKFTLLKSTKEIIRNHVGLLRYRSSKPSLYGLAQREWWLAFKKGEGI